MANKKVEVTVVYTNLGSRGLENQTRYNTADIMAILNFVEATTVENGRTQENDIRWGSVIALTDSRKAVYYKQRGYWEGDDRKVVAYPSWVQEGTWQAWNIVQVTPPDMLHTNALEALSWDGVLAPEELGNLLEVRFADQHNYGTNVGGDRKRSWPIRVEAERQSKKRAPDVKPYLSSTLGQGLDRDAQAVSEALWALMRTRGMADNKTKAKMHALGAAAEFAELEQLTAQIETHLNGITEARDAIRRINSQLIKYAIPNRSK